MEVLKAGLGVVAGVPDVVLIRAGHAYGLELKADDGRPSAKQIEAVAAMETEGRMNPKAWPMMVIPKCVNSR